MSAQLIRKLFISIALTQLTFITVQAQVIPSGSGFGEGVITVGWFGFPPDSKTPRDPVSILNVPNIYSLTYFIKGDKILRKDRTDSASNKDSATQTVDVDGGTVKLVAHAEVQHQSYVIDWKKRKVYTLKEERGSLKVEEKGLQNETTEIFYRVLDKNDKTDIISLEKDNPVYIANKKCLRGTAKVEKTSEIFTFYYSESTAKLQSPLNGFLPPGFPYNVMRVDLTNQWTMEDGRISNAPMIFQILEVKEMQLADSIFSIPGYLK